MTLNERTFEAISHLKDLTILDFAGCKGITAAGLRHLLKLKDLVVLKLNFTDANDQSVSALLGHSRIDKLVLRNTHVTDWLLDQLAKDKLPTLTTIELGGNKQITAAGVERARNRKSFYRHKLNVESGERPTLDNLN